MSSAKMLCGFLKKSQNFGLSQLLQAREFIVEWDNFKGLNERRHPTAGHPMNDASYSPTVIISHRNNKPAVALGNNIIRENAFQITLAEQTF
jgi:hypothetical protein